MLKCFCDACEKEIPEAKDVWMLDILTRNGETSAANSGMFCPGCHSAIIGAVLAAKDEKVAFLKEAALK